MRKFAVLALIFCVRMGAQTQTAKDLLPAFNDIEKKVVALVEAMPEEKIGWRPQGARSFGEAALHLAFGNYLLLNFTKGKTPSQQDILNKIKQHEKFENSGAGKGEIVKTLQQSFAAVRKSLESKTAEELAATVDFFGRQVSTAGMFSTIAIHGSEHLGQLISYARMNNVTPPWSAKE